MEDRVADLNKLSDGELKTAKKQMDTLFDANRLKPGDPGYVYDKRVRIPPRSTRAIGSPVYYH
jgi:hypothetical protein